MDPTRILDAIADRTRRRLLAALSGRPLTVRTVAEGLGVTASAASQHLKVLREAGLVTCQSIGKQRIYRLAPEALESSHEAMTQLLQPPRQERAPPADDPLRSLAYQRASAWPRLDPLSVLITFRVERLVHAIYREMKGIAAKGGLTPGEMLALGALAAVGPPYEASPTELKQALWISLPGVGKRLDLLATRGLVERLPNPEDGRAQIVRLTARGREALEATGLGMEGGSYAALEQLSGVQKEMLERLLRRWQRAVEDAPAA